MQKFSFIILILTGFLLFSCQKEVITPNHPSSQDSIESFENEPSKIIIVGSTNEGGGDEGDIEITDPNNDEDQNKKKNDK